MSVAYGGSIVVPYLCGLYTCECGRRSLTHGRDAGAPPHGWHERPDGRHLCESCGEARTQSAPKKSA